MFFEKSVQFENVRLLNPDLILTTLLVFNCNKFLMAHNCSHQEVVSNIDSERENKTKQNNSTCFKIKKSFKTFIAGYCNHRQQ